MFLNFFVETFSLGLKNIRLHKLRSLLTTLGIIFGVSAVIIMVAIGEGSKQTALEQLRQLGAKNILIRSIPPPESSEASSRTQRILEYGLKRIDRNRIEILPSIAIIVPMKATEQRVVFGDRRLPSASAIGTEPQIFEVLNLPLERGRYLNHIDMRERSAVCVVGAAAAEQLFPYQDPIGQKIQVGGANTGAAVLEVVGVLEKTGLRPGGATAVITREIDQDIYFPLSLCQTVFGDRIIKRTAGSEEQKLIELSEIWVQTKREEDVEDTAKVIENVLLSSRQRTKDYEVKVPLEILRNAEKLNKVFNFIMGGIAAISLIVGGIGIMNIMLASITERTKEIGIRRALGAKRSHITLQFLVETTVISLTGGALGVVLGCTIATILPWLVQRFSHGADYRTVIASWSVGGSFVISGLIGIGFGLYPAITAARMDPIEALRHE
jgi:putative ABC transport system permease protein